MWRQVLWIAASVVSATACLAQVTGVVVDSHDVPQPGIPVAISGDCGRRLEKVVTDTNGQFCLEVGPGIYTISVAIDGQLLAATSLNTLETPSARLRLRLSPEEPYQNYTIYDCFDATEVYVQTEASMDERLIPLRPIRQLRSTGHHKKR